MASRRVNSFSVEAEFDVDDPEGYRAGMAEPGMDREVLEDPSNGVKRRENPPI